MRRRDLVFWVVAAIAASTLVAGLVQLVAPGFVLDLVDAERTASTRHLFAVIGMFMAVVGGLLGHMLLLPPDVDRDRLVLLWAAIQKAGAFVMVALGIADDVFGGLAVLVALNDLGSAVVLGWIRQARAR
jgi:hypothetical protein